MISFSCRNQKKKSSYLFLLFFYFAHKQVYLLYTHTYVSIIRTSDRKFLVYVVQVHGKVVLFYKIIDDIQKDFKKICGENFTGNDILTSIIYFIYIFVFFILALFIPVPTFRKVLGLIPVLRIYL